MENKTVETKKVTKATVDFKALCESTEDAFGKIDTVDVIADTNLPKGPKYTTVAEWRMVHFYKPGTDKDMFQLIMNSKGATFIVRNKAIEYLDKTLTKNPVEKKVTVKGEKVVRVIHHEVTCDLKDIVATAKKIVTAYQSIPVEEPKTKKKAEKAISAEPKKAEKKPAPKKAEPKKNIAKRPKKAVATA